jgi:hypothetical protein
MIKDITLQGICILLTGFVFPFLSGIITYNNYSVIELLGSGLYFFLIAMLVAAGCQRVTGLVRQQFRIRDSAVSKILLLSFWGALYSTIITGLMAYGWINLSKEPFDWNIIFKACAVSGILAVIFVLSNEIVLLSKERVLDTKIVDQLDKERSFAELSVLNSELDPHFMFNSLLTLSQLIAVDAKKAQLFIDKLSKVYKYILLNKERELISLQKELAFIEDYFFLLQIRHDNKLKLEINFRETDPHKNMVLPCSLQVLVENAIKHNEFSETNPLHIQVHSNGEYIKVSNRVRLRSFPENSTNVGLRNLSQRYRLICNRDITIEQQKSLFTVKLPLITNKS